MIEDMIGGIFKGMISESGCLGRLVLRVSGIAFTAASLLVFSQIGRHEGLSLLFFSFGGGLLSIGLLNLTGGAESRYARFFGFCFLGFFILVIVAFLQAGMAGHLDKVM